MCDVEEMARAKFNEIKRKNFREASNGFMVFVMKGKFKHVGSGTGVADRHLESKGSHIAGVYDFNSSDFSVEHYIEDCKLAYADWLTQTGSTTSKTGGGLEYK